MPCATGIFGEIHLWCFWCCLLHQKGQIPRFDRSFRFFCTLCWTWTFFCYILDSTPPGTLSRLSAVIDHEFFCRIGVVEVFKQAHVFDVNQPTAYSLISHCGEGSDYGFFDFFHRFQFISNPPILPIIYIGNLILFLA